MYRSNAGPEFLKAENSGLNGRCPVAVLTPPLGPVIATHLVKDARHSVAKIWRIVKRNMVDVSR